MRTSFLVVLFVILIGTTAHADVPQKIHYQGYLTDSVGTPFQCDLASCDSPVDLTFRLYESVVSGEPLWGEVHQGVVVNQGLFNIILGDTVSLPLAVLTGDRWLGIEVNQQGEMFPRQRIVAAPYALRSATTDQAENAQTLGGLAVDNFVQIADTDGFIDQSELGGLLQDLGYLPGDNDTLGSLTDCALSETLAWDGNAWICAANTDEDTLSTLLCAGSEIVRWDGISWICDTDQVRSDAEIVQVVGDAEFALQSQLFSGDYTDLSNIPVDQVRSDAEIVQVVGDAEFALQSQLFSGDFGDLTNPPTDQDSLAALSCAENQIAKWDGAAWACGEDVDTDTTIADTTLTETEVDAFVENNGYAIQADLASLEATVDTLSTAWTDTATEVSTDSNVEVLGNLEVGDGTSASVIDIAGSDGCGEAGSLTNGFVDDLPGPIIWTHTYTAFTGSISSATLTIDIGDADSGTLDVVSSEGVLIGTISGADHGGPGPWQCPAAWSENVLTVPAAAFDDMKDGSFTLQFQNNTGVGTWGTNRAILDISGGASLTVNGSVSATNYITTSDRRLKEDIRTIDNALEKLLQLRGVQYHFKDHRAGGTDQVGVIAQDVEQLFPGLVQTTGAGFKGVAYGNLVGVLIEALREQQHELETLRQRITDLENETSVHRPHR